MKGAGCTNVWNITPGPVVIDGKQREAFIIHDWFSSDTILHHSKKLIVEQRRKALISFLTQRLAVHSKDCFFIFHLFHKDVPGDDPINYRKRQQISLDAIGNFVGTVEPEILYKLSR